MAFRMELLTAVLSGDRCLELRAFGDMDLSHSDEMCLTAGLCKLMDRNSKNWKRYFTIINLSAFGQS